MAEKRMFAKDIIMSDMFLDMPSSAKTLYFLLGLNADDDGFVTSPKAIMRMCGCNEDDLKILIVKNYLLSFESGVIAITHWRVNNTIRVDRYKSTICKKEREQLGFKKNGEYYFLVEDEADDVEISETETSEAVAVTEIKEVEKEEVKEVSSEKTVTETEKETAIGRPVKEVIEQTSENKDVEEIKEKYIENYKELYTNGNIREEFPNITEEKCYEVLSEKFEKLGKEKCIKILDMAKKDYLCVSNQYSLTLIFSSKVMNILIEKIAIQERKEKKLLTIPKTKEKAVEKIPTPKKCEDCGATLLDDSGGYGSSWFCTHCMDSYILFKGKWVKESKILDKSKKVS